MFFIFLPSLKIEKKNVNQIAYLWAIYNFKDEESIFTISKNAGHIWILKRLSVGKKKKENPVHANLLFDRFHFKKNVHVFLHK